MPLERICERLSQALMVVAAFWGFALAVFIALDVSGRNLFDHPLTGTTEAISNSVVVIVFLQLPYAVRSRSMLRADFLVHLFPPAAQRALNILCYLGGLIVFGLVVYACIEPMTTAWIRGEFEGEGGSVRIPTWPIYAVIIGGSALATLNYVFLLLMEIFDARRAAGEERHAAVAGVGSQS